MSDIKQIRDDVSEYYGEVLSSSDDLKTSACCPIDAMPDHVKPLIANIHDEVLSRFYGCGSPLPFCLNGKTVLDLGCGTGRDVYVASQLVGEDGYVIGVDMTDEQLDVARKYEDYHIEKFGFKKSNIEFHKGHIEDLGFIADGSIDVVISNCVINLSSDKEKVFKEIFRVLKKGGELYFSDVFSGRRIPEELKTDKVLLGECLGGALYIEDFRRMMEKVGCLDHRIMSKSVITLEDKDIKAKAGMIDFYSITVRAFKCDFEDLCEDYGQVAYYQGGISEAPHEFMLDDHHLFKKGLPYPVCGNTALMLSETRYKDYFKIIGDMSTHYGVFDCSDDNNIGDTNGGCC